jgi:hypothetical protein
VDAAAIEAVVVRLAAVLEGLSEHDWQVAFNTWCRGWDHWIARTWDAKSKRLGRRWRLAIPGVRFASFTTKFRAYSVAGRAFCLECARRQRVQAEQERSAPPPAPGSP